MRNSNPNESGEKEQSEFDFKLSELCKISEKIGRLKVIQALAMSGVFVSVVYLIAKMVERYG